MNENKSRARKGLPEFSLFLGFPVMAAVSLREYNLGFKNNTASSMASGRRDFLSALGIVPEYLVTAKQVHGNHARVVGRADRGSGAFEYDSALDGTDALITAERGVPIAVFSADCLTIFVYDSRVHACGLVHAGWRGTAGKILLNSLELMREEFGCRREELLLVLGPSIRNCCYEVGEEFRNHFPGSVSERNGRLYFDLIKENVNQAVSSGIPLDNISVCDSCNSCDNNFFFSYRREGPACGRNMSVMMLK